MNRTVGWSTVNRNTGVGDAREVMALMDALSGSSQNLTAYDATLQVGGGT